jgi:glutathione S-transferase
MSGKLPPGNFGVLQQYLPTEDNSFNDEEEAMTLVLYGHPFSSYTQKALIAFYENATLFKFRVLGPTAPENFEALKKLWPIAKFPVLDDEGVVIFEATMINEHLEIHHAGPVRLIPADPQLALDVRMMDRIFDNYVMTPMNWIVQDARRPPEARDAQSVAQGRALLDTTYRWLNQRMAARVWASGEMFSMADCAAAPSLFYADWAHPISDEFPDLRAYRNRLLARSSFARAVGEARPYRQYFPLGAPDRD